MNSSASEDKARFAIIVLPHLDAAYNLAHWLTGNGPAAEDVVYDASLRAFQAIHSFTGNSARAWVLRIVRNTAYAWLGKNRAVEAARAEPGDSGAQTAALIGKTHTERLRGAIAALPTALRETLVLRDIESLDYREIAEVTEVPIGTVMSRLAHARGRLVAAFGSEGAATILSYHRGQRAG